MIASYPKVMNFGNSGTENALVGTLIIQEKIDGSQFRWGFDNDGNFVMGSHHCEMFYPVKNQLFDEAVKHIYCDKTTELQNMFFFAECLAKNKHNTLTYERIPTNHLVLFDVLRNGRWVPTSELTHWANFWGIDVIPELYCGTVGNSVEGIKSLSKFLDIPSYLGGTKVEGVVVKNYGQYIQIGTQIWPIFTKYVNPEFREKNLDEHHNREGSLEFYIDSFRSEARWQKAVQHLEEQGLLTHSVKDIGNVIMEVKRDIMEEEVENIKEHMQKWICERIVRRAHAGLPEWYKDKIIKEMYHAE